MKKSQAVWLAAVLLLAAGTVHSQDFPTKPVRMIVPFAPGGSIDMVARILQPKLGEVLGQSVLVENRSGAAGNIGVEMVARATPDGHTILFANVGSMAINPSLFPKFPISPMRDLIPITLVADFPGAIAVHSSVPVKTIQDFIAYAKAHPGELTFSGGSRGSASALAIEYFNAKQGIKMTNVVYSGGGGPATIALLSGELKVLVMPVASLVPHVKGGKIRLIGIMSEGRVDYLPETPTLAESGFPELTRGSWQGVAVPAGTPKPVVTKLYSTFIKVLNDPWVHTRFAEAGARLLTSKSPDDFTDFLKSQTAFWAGIVKQTGAAVQ